MQLLKKTNLSLLTGLFAGFLIALAGAGFRGCSNQPPLEAWHTENLDLEFTAEQSEEQALNFNKYMEIEDKLFNQLDKKVYTATETGPDQILNRYSAGSAADPRNLKPNWNRSFEFPGNGSGGVLLLHGMSDSPYSLRALGETLNRKGFHVIGLRLPGHGTAPSGLKHVHWKDMAAAVSLAMDHLYLESGSSTWSLHIIGYSTGASLALDFTLNALEGKNSAVPDSLVLVSPAIRVHGAARFAGLKAALSILPGLENLAWLNVMDEFDPYKYNSFATNAGFQVHNVTIDVDRRIRALSRLPSVAGEFPPVLVLKSTVDTTVTTDAVVDNLLALLPADRNELVLFDINRQAAIKSTLLVSDPGPLTKRLLAEDDLPFAISFVSNANPYSNAMEASYKEPHSSDSPVAEPLGLEWPRGVVSLSHIALPFPPDDPLYGKSQAAELKHIFLGDMALKGELGLLKISEQWLLRMRYNPFYSYLEKRVLDWIEEPAGMKRLDSQ
jgi:pimeloyl-ACP methyl ester carboxylesterase